jgi:hypothetical protein
MRLGIGLLFVAGAAACASGRPPRTTPSTTYSCGDGRQIQHARDRVTSADTQLAVGWNDDEGRHFVSWPMSSTRTEAVEYVIPADGRMDAIERIYDTSKGPSRVDWRVVKQSFCTANGGYTDALARFATGKTLDQVAQELELTDKREARELVHNALISIQKRYYKDR